MKPTAMFQSRFNILPAAPIFSSPAVLLRCVLLSFFALSLYACEREGALVAESEYRTALIGDWQGTVGDEQETLSFTQEGRFTAQLLREGFISNTLGQGEPGTVSGTWTLQGPTITLAIDNTDNVNALNLSTISTIVSFKQNELLIRSSEGQTSVFVRAQ